MYVYNNQAQIQLRSHMIKTHTTHIDTHSKSFPSHKVKLQKPKFNIRLTRRTKISNKEIGAIITRSAHKENNIKNRIK